MSTESQGPVPKMPVAPVESKPNPVISAEPKRGVVKTEVKTGFGDAINNWIGDFVYRDPYWRTAPIVDGLVGAGLGTVAGAGALDLVNRALVGMGGQALNIVPGAPLVLGAVTGGLSALYALLFKVRWAKNKLPNAQQPGKEK